MKILLVNVTEEMPERVQKIYHEILAKVCGTSSELVIRDTTPGLTRMMDMAYSYGHLLNNRSFCERAIEAQVEGFDAVLTTETLDSGVQEARELVDIPIIAPGETVLHYASLLGNKIGLVTLQDLTVCLMWEKAIIDYGLKSKAIVNPVRGVNLATYDAVTKGMDDNSIIVKAVEEKARELVQDGAEVIIIGCGLYGPVCTLNGLVKLEGDVPIVDPIAISFKLTQVMLDLKTSIGLPVLSRVGMYPRMPEKYIKRIREHVGLL